MTDRFYIPTGDLANIVPGKRWRVHDREHEDHQGFTGAVAVKDDPDFWKRGDFWPMDMEAHGAYFATREEAVAWMRSHGSEEPPEEGPDPLPKETRTRVSQAVHEELEARGMRRCASCERIKMLCADNFPRRRGGFARTCKVCHNRRSAEHRNRKKDSIPKPGPSKYKGVSWDRGMCKWRAFVYVGKTRVAAGAFTDERSAALAYDMKAVELLGEKAKTNAKEGRL